MRKALCIVFLIFCRMAFSQAAIEARQNQTLPRSLTVIVTGVSSDDLQAFGNSQGKQVANYHIYLIEHADDPQIHVTDVTGTFIAPAAAIIFDGALLRVPLLSDFQNSNVYVLALDNVPGTHPSVSSRINAKPTLSSPDVDKTRTEIKVSSGIRLSAAPSGISVQRRRFVRSGTAAVESPQVYAVTISRTEPDGIFIELTPRLPSGTQSDLTVTGLVDGAGNAINAKGSVTTIGVPANEKDAWLLTKLNSSAAVHAGPVFQFAGTAAPLNPPSRAKYLCRNWFTLCSLTAFDQRGIRFNPSINFDIGFNTTKAANSVIVPAPFQYQWIFDSLPLGFRNLNFSFGPRFETDRKFARYNVLGEYRTDFVHKWFFHSVSTQKKLAGGSDPGLIEGINWGYEIIPYVQFDGGGHTNEEVVKNTTTSKSVTVPTHGVARTSVGLQNTFEYRRATVTIDSAMIYFGIDEIVGFTTKKDAALRRLEGIQPHSKLSFDYALDAAKHFSANITYENGRSAPNFEFLNKIDTGIKVIF